MIIIKLLFSTKLFKLGRYVVIVFVRFSTASNISLPLLVYCFHNLFVVDVFNINPSLVSAHINKLLHIFPFHPNYHCYG